MDLDFMKYYTSLSVSFREEEQIMVSKSIESGLVPDKIRYSERAGSFHGVIKSSDDYLFYFNMVGGNFKLVRADDPTKIWDAKRMIEKSDYGCDLIKGEGAAGGQGSIAGMPTVEEEDDVSRQHDLLTDKHPGAAMGSTPDDPAVGRQWHEEPQPVIIGKGWDASSLLDGLNDSLRKSIEPLTRPVSNKEKQFMVEVLGRTPDQLGRGDVYMNPTQKVVYQQWLNKSMTDKASSLTDWIKKNE